MSMHAISRAKERLGIDVNHADLEESLALLGTSARAVLVTERDGCELWIVPLKGVMAGLYVRADRKAVVTVIPADRMAFPARRGEYSRQTRHALKRTGKFGRRGARLKKLAAMGVE